MGLIARAIEEQGIATTSISIARDFTQRTGVPRSVFVKWPLGHPLGEPGNVLQHRVMIYHALRLLVDVEEAGYIEDAGFRWKREKYTEPDWANLLKN